MVEVKDLSEWSKLPGWIQRLCLAETQSMLDRLQVHSDAVALVTCIAYDAEQLDVSMVVQITHVPQIVKVSLKKSN